MLAGVGFVVASVAALAAGQAVPGQAVPGQAVPGQAVPGQATPQGTTDLVGTWSSKSNKTLTGPGFYDPVNERLIEPSHTGISYSFTADGNYEVAYYRAVPNPQEPACPKGIMQWQHGSFTKEQNGSLVLNPIKVDGRQLFSDPCKYKNAIYTRYNQSELFERYSVYTDPYHNIPRLDLFKFDGSPLMPLYLAFSPPQMLPVQTLNPTAASTGAGPQQTKSSNKLFKRSAPADPLPLNHEFMQKRQATVLTHTNFILLGLATTGFGSVLYFFF